jgi:hypothetical protein
VGLPERTELSLARPKHQYVLPDDLKLVRLVRRRKGGRELVSLRFFRALDTIVDLPLTSDGLARMMRVLSASIAVFICQNPPRLASPHYSPKPANMPQRGRCLGRAALV